MKNKKILSISLLAVLIFSLLMPFGSAFASSTNLISGALPISNQNIWTSASNSATPNLGILTDGTGDSSNVITAHHVTDTNNVKVRYQLGSTSTIDKIMLSNGARAVFSVRFLDSSGVEIKAYNYQSIQVGSTASWDNTAYSITPVENVKYVELYTNTNGSDGGNYLLSEFAVYGTGVSAPISHSEIGNLVSSVNQNSATLTYSIPNGDSNYTGSKIYRDGVLIKTNTALESSFVDNGLAWNTTYSYKVTATYSDGFETTGLTTTVITGTQPVDPSTIAPNPVVGLTTQSIDYDKAVLSWNLPTDSDLSNVLIYKNDVLLDTVAVTNTYTVTGLSPETQYKLSVALKDTDGNIGQKSDLNITTLVGPDVVAPDSPTGVTVSVGDSALFVQWKKVVSDDLHGYNIYVDGVKYNTTVYKNDFITITDLTNDTPYSIQVSSVDTNGNESSLTTAKMGTPKSGAMPVVKTKYQLADVAYGVSEWFDSYWLIIAFASAIPLSFYIASRIKLMFID